jgi:dienelactone hydrolase
LIVRALLPLVVLAAVLAPAGTTAGPAIYSGTIRFAGAEPSGIGLRIAGNAVTITLGPGHVAQARAPLRRVKGRLRFSAPGLPRPLAFVLRAEGMRLTGTATQGGVRAAVTLIRGRVSPDTTLGFYSSPQVEIARFTRFGFSTAPFAIDVDTGAFVASPSTGARLDVRQYEVRIPAAGAVLAGTLTVPPGPGAHPGVVYVSGSGPTLREEAQWLESVFVSRGIAVLAYDKRGNGQSTGRYPGSLAAESTIRTLAGDAVAAARFLAAQSGVDRTRVGFYGLSQGGWIIPQAVGRAGGAVSWALIQSGPTVTQGESDTYANLVASGVSLPDAEAQARAAGPSGYDPRTWIERLRIPVLWLYAGQDRAQPIQHSREILRALSAGHDFAVEYYPAAPHPLFDATGFPTGLFATVRDWLGEHKLAD